jgi:hypothetical protein
MMLGGEAAAAAPLKQIASATATTILTIIFDLFVSQCVGMLYVQVTMTTSRPL